MLNVKRNNEKNPHEYIYRRTPVMTFFSVPAGMSAYIFTKNNSITYAFL